MLPDTLPTALRGSVLLLIYESACERITFTPKHQKLTLYSPLVALFIISNVNCQINTTWTNQSEEIDTFIWPLRVSKQLTKLALLYAVLNAALTYLRIGLRTYHFERPSIKSLHSCYATRSPCLRSCSVTTTLAFDAGKLPWR